MKMYLVTLIDQHTGQTQKIVVQASCTHDMQGFVDDLVASDDPGIALSNPVVCDGGIELIPDPLARRLLQKKSKA